MSTPLFSAIDALVPLVVLVVIGFLIRSVAKGDFRTDPNHRYAEHQVHAYNTAGAWDLYYGKSTLRYFHEECSQQHFTEAVQNDEFYELWLNERDIDRHCQHCE